MLLYAPRKLINCPGGIKWPTIMQGRVKTPPVAVHLLRMENTAVPHARAQATRLKSTATADIPPVAATSDWRVRAD